MPILCRLHGLSSITFISFSNYREYMSMSSVSLFMALVRKVVYSVTSN